MKGELFKGRARLNMRQIFFSMKILDMWNDLLQKIIDFSSKCFQSRLETFWENEEMKFDLKIVWTKIKPDSETRSGSADDLDLSIYVASCTQQLLRYLKVN